MLLPQAVRLLLLRSLALTLTFFSVGSIFMAREELNHREHFAHGMKESTPTPPSSKPPMTQESIDLAMKMFHIEVPAGASYPRLDANLEDRGLTTMNGWGKDLDVTVGPAAFTSWALLGSTLAHELEVHCHQSFFLIRVKDLVGMKGTDDAEREAYLHELTNSERFHLKTTDQLNIRATMDYYYPVARLSSEDPKATANQ